MKKITGYEAVHIIVDCEKNDSVDIRCGGPDMLGYDFYVDPDNVNEMIEFIKKELEKQKQPLLNIQKVEHIFREKLWDKKSISECISKGYN